MQIIVSMCIAVVGWTLNQWLARRSLRRATSIEYLLSAYRRLEAASNRRMTEEHARNIESALADVQLLGSTKQIALAVGIAKTFAANQKAAFDELLNDMRRSLREELLLDHVTENPIGLSPPARPPWLTGEVHPPTIAL